ncbi:MAG: DDE-type integrase/transposase/recombinase [Pseudonocardia sp.]|nr:DDE-type integrase/transposase/recombinase [Pseudonocardia sp.]
MSAPPGGSAPHRCREAGPVPDGGGRRLHGRCEEVRGRKVHGGPIGYDYLHVAVDDHSRLAYIEALPDERDLTCAGFLRRAVTWFREHGVRVLRILTDNAKARSGRRRGRARRNRAGSVRRGRPRAAASDRSHVSWSPRRTLRSSCRARPCARHQPQARGRT